MGELVKCKTENCPAAKKCRRKTDPITFRQKYDDFKFKIVKGIFIDKFVCDGQEE